MRYSLSDSIVRLRFAAPLPLTLCAAVVPAYLPFSV